MSCHSMNSTYNCPARHFALAQNVWLIHTLHSTVGAGDTFIAGMLYANMAHYQEWSLSRKLKFANELAGRKVVQEGFSGLGELMKEWL